MFDSFESQLINLASSKQPPSPTANSSSALFLNSGHISHAASQLQQQDRSSSSSTNGNQTKTMQQQNDDEQNDNNSSIFFDDLTSLCSRWSSTTSSSIADDEVATKTLINDTRKLFSKIATTMLQKYHINHNENNESSTTNALLDSSLISVVWHKMSSVLVSEISQFLTDCVQAMSACDPSKQEFDDEDEDESDDEEEDEESTTSTTWFTSVKIILRHSGCFKCHRTSSFWEVLNELSWCLSSSHRLIKNIVSSSQKEEEENDNFINDNIVHPIVNSLLLRIDYHFGAQQNQPRSNSPAATNENDDDDQNQQSIESPDTNRNQEAKQKPSPYANRPEHVLQYIGSLYLLLRHVTSKLSSSKSSSIESQQQQQQQLLSRFEQGSTQLFSSICVGPLVSALYEKSSFFQLSSMIASASSEILKSGKAFDELLSHLSFRKKEQQNAASSLSSSSSPSENETVDTKINNKSPSTTVAQDLAASLDTNVRLLHLLNVLNEFVSQLSSSSRKLTRQHQSCSCIPCVSIVSDQHATIAAAVAVAVHDYASGALVSLHHDQQREISETEKIRAQTQKVMQETSWEKIVSMTSNNNNKSSSSSFALLSNSIGSLRVPNFATTSAHLALSLTAQNLAVFRQLFSIKSNPAILENDDNADCDQQENLPAFLELFLSRVIRQVVLRQVAVNIDSEFEKVAELVVSLPSSILNASSSLSDENHHNNDDKATSTNASTTTINSVATFKTCRVIAETVVKICAPLAIVESVFQKQLPGMLLLEDDDESKKEIISSILIQPTELLVKTVKEKLFRLLCVIKQNSNNNNNHQQQVIEQVTKMCIDTVLFSMSEEMKQSIFKIMSGRDDDDDERRIVIDDEDDDTTTSSSNSSVIFKHEESSSSSSSSSVEFQVEKNQSQRIVDNITPDDVATSTNTNTNTNTTNKTSGWDNLDDDDLI